MHTIKLQLDDNLYEDITQSCIDNRDLLISIERATKRVTKAIENYENGTGEYLTNQEYKAHISKHIEKLKVKYADN